MPCQGRLSCRKGPDLAFRPSVCQRTKMSRRQLLRRLTSALVFLPAACATRAPLPAPAPPPERPEFAEENLPAIERPRLAIIDLEETVDAGQGTVTLTGTLVNRGAGPTREIFVRVRALDRQGAVLFRERSVPTTQVIPPGGTGHFSVTLADHDDVDRYHLEAFAR